MSESTFAADLDALVQGQTIHPSDDLTHFVAGLYEKERAMPMNPVLRNQIANQLGLATKGVGAAAPVPVSRRTARMSATQPRSTRPWVVTLTIAAAMLLALTGVLRWGLPDGGDDSDDRFLFASPAVPTVEATPAAAVESELAWLRPISPDECELADIATPAATVDPVTFDHLPERNYSVRGPAEATDADLAVSVVRQLDACGGRDAIFTDRLIYQRSLISEGFSPYVVAVLSEQKRDGLSLSAGLEELGLKPIDLTFNVNADKPGFDAFDGTSTFIPNAAHAVVLVDGRIVIPMVQALVQERVITGPRMGISIISIAYVLDFEHGSWKVDDQLPICLGQCYSELTDMERYAHDTTWIQPIAPEECVRNASVPAVFTDAQVAATRSRQAQACELSGDATVLQSPAYRVTEHADAQPLSDEIAALYGQTDNVPGRLQRVIDPDMIGVADLPTEPYFVYSPESAVELADGRIAVLETRVVKTDSVVGTGRTSPVVTEALVWVRDGDDWLLDEELTVCLGDCDAYWGSDPEPATATPVALVIPETCTAGGVFVSDFTSDHRIAVGLRPGPGVASGVSVATVPAGTTLHYLCEHAVTTNPTVDRMAEGQRWLKVRTEDGTEGWIREVDVQP